MIAGLLATRAAKKTHLPNVTGYLIAGLLVGPFVLNLIPAEPLEGLGLISTMALGFIAFSIGGEFKLSSIRAVGKSAIIITFTQAFGAVVLVDLALWAFGYDVPLAITLGAIATATAPAATLMVVRQYKAKGPLTNTLLPVVAMDDAIGLMVFSISLAMAKALSSGQAVTSKTMLIEPLMEIGLSLVIGAVIGFLSSLAIRFFHSKGNRLSICIASVLLGVALAKSYHLSDLLLCMAIGATMVNLREDSTELMELSEAWTPPLFMLFFVISGAELNVSVLPSVGVLGLIYILVRALGKYLGATIGARIVKAPQTIQKYLGITLLPQAGVAIGMAQLVTTALPKYGATIQAVVLCATLIYELLGPVATKIALTKAGEITIKPEKITDTTLK